MTDTVVILIYKKRSERCGIKGPSPARQSAQGTQAGTVKELENLARAMLTASDLELRKAT